MYGDNEDLVQKTINTDMMATGGQLSPVQQAAFVQLVKDNSVFLQKARFVPMPTSRKLVDKLYLGEPVTRAASQNTNVSTDSRTTFDQVALNAEKVKSDWSITTETLQENIEGDAFEDTVMSMMTKRIATDMELLAFQGDTTAATGTPLGNLLATYDGYDVITDAAHLVDAGGATIEKEIFSAAQYAMPEQYLQDPDLRWIVPRVVAIGWNDQIAQRETLAGDKALSGESLMPYGIPMMVVPAMPTRKALTVATATPAYVHGTQFGPYEFVAATNDAITINVNAGGNVAITMTAGVYTVVEFISAFRAKLVAAGALGIAASAALTMYDDGQGRIIMETTTTGAATSIEFVAVANDGYDELGVTAASVTGAAAGSNTTYDGTVMFLANPKNFMFGMVDDTRIYSEFNKDYDRTEFVVYNQTAINVENLEAIVKVVNLKRQ